MKILLPQLKWYWPRRKSSDSLRLSGLLSVRVGRGRLGKTGLADIAIHTGGSSATASRVLNNKTSVSAQTCALVLDAVSEVGYDNRVRLRGSALANLIVPDLTKPVFPAFAQAITTALAQRGFTALMYTRPSEGTMEDEYLDVLLDHEVAGMNSISGHHADPTADLLRYHLLRERGTP